MVSAKYGVVTCTEFLMPIVTVINYIDRLDPLLVVDSLFCLTGRASIHRSKRDDLHLTSY